MSDMGMDSNKSGEWILRDAPEKIALDWHFKGKVWHYWELYEHGNLMASLKSKRFFTLLFEGSFQSMSLQIRKSAGQVTVSNSKSGGKIGAIDRVFPLPAILRMADGTEYCISRASYVSKPKKMYFLISDVEGRDLARTEFNNIRTPIFASFETLELRAGDIDPWLAAVILLYCAIADSYW
jgi:hypothetical protein